MKLIEFIVLSSYIALTVGFLAAIFFLSLNLISLVSCRDKMKNNDKVQPIKLKIKNIWHQSVHSKHVQEFRKWIWFQKAENSFNQKDRCFCFISCCKKSWKALQRSRFSSLEQTCVQTCLQFTKRLYRSHLHSVLPSQATSHCIQSVLSYFGMPGGLYWSCGAMVCWDAVMSWSKMYLLYKSF